MPEIDIQGTRFYYNVYGSGKETLVFAHGFLMDSEMFRYQISALENDYRIVVFDWPGQGKSGPLPDDCDMEKLHACTVSFLNALNLQNIHWIGVSMGGFIGLRMAARNPGLLKSLVAAETSDEAEKFHKKIKWGLLAYIFKFFGAKPVVKGIQKALFGKTRLNDPSFRPVLEEYARKWEKLDRKDTFRIAWSIFNRPAITGELKNIRIPVLVVVGDEDISRPVDEARRMTARIPGAKLEIIPQAGHSSPLEQPAYFNKTLTAFIERQ